MDLNDINKNNAAEYERLRTANAIIASLAPFDIRLEITDIIAGATVTRYVFNILSPKTRLSEFRAHYNDIRNSIQTQDDIMIYAPIAGTFKVAVEVVNVKRRLVELSDLLEKSEAKDVKGSLIFALGEQSTGGEVYADLTKMPHMLIAGTTGSGKSILLNDIIVSIMYRYSPDYVRFLIVDPKSVEMSVYNGAPHMLTPEIVTEPSDALASMDYLIAEMESRYQLFSKKGVPSIKDYNKSVDSQTEKKLPYLVLIVDEFSHIMDGNKAAFEGKLLRLAQKSRATGIHVILATQRPSSDVITGTIKVNMPCRAALKVFSAYDSQTVLNSGGAEKLSGRGDMLLFDANNSVEFTRIQCAYITLNEVRAVIEKSIEIDGFNFDKSIYDAIFVSRAPVADKKSDVDGKARDSVHYPYYKQALRYWLERCGGKASISSLQRGIGVGFNRAGRIFDDLQKMGYVETPSPDEQYGTKPLMVLVKLEDLDKLFPD